MENQKNDARRWVKLIVFLRHIFLRNFFFFRQTAGKGFREIASPCGGGEIATYCGFLLELISNYLRFFYDIRKVARGSVHIIQN